MTGSVVLAVDGSESARRAMQWCANYAPVAGAKVTVVHAVEIGYSFYELGAGATAPHPTHGRGIAGGQTSPGRSTKFLIFEKARDKQTIRSE